MSRFLPQSVLPKHFGSSLGLAWRVLRQGGRSGRFTLASSALGLIAAPFDLALSRRESALYQKASDDQTRLVFVCGPPRSGTTAVELLLLSCFRCNYLTNLTAIFPRSPLAASHLLRIGPRTEAVDLDNHYGKTRRLAGPSDAHHLWDRWLGTDRRHWSSEKPVLDADGMRRFFSAWGDEFGRDIITKNNALNVVARTVGQELPGAVFLCLDREPLFLAQSHLKARRYIHRDEATPYGVHHPDRSEDPFDDIARQIRFYEREAAENEAQLGPDRFWRLQYEDVCAHPRAILDRVSRFLDQEPHCEPPTLKNQNIEKLPKAELRILSDALANQGF